MIFDYLQRGAIAGTIGGSVYGLYVAAVGNPIVNYIEGLVHEGHDHTHDPSSETLVTEGLMQAVSIGTSIAIGILFGIVMFGVVYYFLEPALPARKESFLLGIMGFLIISGIPWLVLPPKAPGVEMEMATRTALWLYGGLMGTAVVACLFGGYAYYRVASQSSSIAAIIGIITFIVVVGVVVVLAPAPEYNSDLPSDLETTYIRVVAIGQVGLWGVTAAAHEKLK
jgi:predicted cobalt transporter CbtA